MSYIVTTPDHTETYRGDDWRTACAIAWACDGKVSTVGAFDDGRKA